MHAAKCTTEKVMGEVSEITLSFPEFMLIKPLGGILTNIFTNM